MIYYLHFDNTIVAINIINTTGISSLLSAFIFILVINYLETNK